MTEHICTQVFDPISTSTGSTSSCITSILPTRLHPGSSFELRLPVQLPDGTLSISMQGCSNFVKAKVQKYASAYLTLARVKFRFSETEPGEIRVGFKPGRSWSFVGTSGLFCNGDTMNFGWFGNHTTDREFSQTTVHMFGHALGGVHDLDQPERIPTQPKHFDRTYDWSKERGVAYETLSLHSPKSVSLCLDMGDDDADNEESSDTATEGGMTTPRGTESGDSEISRYGGNGPITIGIYSPSPHGFSSGGYSTSDQRASNKPIACNEKKIVFFKKYQTPPTITVGLTAMELEHIAKAPQVARIACFSDNIRRDSFYIHINSWEQARIRYSSCNWLETTHENPEFQVGTFRFVYSHGMDGSKLDYSELVEFERPYDKPPKIVVWLNYLDIASSLRIDAFADGVSTHGFKINIQSWNDCKLFGAGVSWIAYPSDRPGTASGKVSTNDYRTYTEPNSINGQEIRFPEGTVFESVPKVLMGLSFMDIYRPRIEVFATRIWNGGMRWNANAWGDTEVYAVGVDYLAFV